MRTRNHDAALAAMVLGTLVVFSAMVGCGSSNLGQQIGFDPVPTVTEAGTPTATPTT